MTTFLPKEVQDGLEAARKAALKRSTRLRVKIGDDVLPILRFSGSTFSMDVEDAPRLRGLVDIYDGPRHLYQALIVACAEEDGERRYEFKRATRPEQGPAPDHVQDGPAIAGLLTNN